MSRCWAGGQGRGRRGDGNVFPVQGAVCGTEGCANDCSDCTGLTPLPATTCCQMALSPLPDARTVRLHDFYYHVWRRSCFLRKSC